MKMENERKRILELVKQGIISTEEALTLLENISKKEGKSAAKENIRRSTAPTEEVEEAPEKSPHTIIVKVGIIKAIHTQLQRDAKDARNHVWIMMKDNKKNAKKTLQKIVTNPCVIWLMTYPRLVKKSVHS